MSSGEPLPRPEDFSFIHEIEVRFRDLDAMGHINNAVFATYLETARIRYMHELGRPGAERDESAAGQPFILLDLYCRYVAQAGYGERMMIHVRTSKIGTKSFQLEYLVTSKEDGRTVAVGNTTQVWFDYARGQTLEIPDEFRRAVEELDGDGGADRA
jgi:acyl-CoA thioester hydrolase